MKSYFNNITPKSEFARNVLTLMTGTTIAQAIPIAISPILTRIYTPEDFGVLALFIAITSIFGSIANGRYELAIMLPKKDEDAINIFALGFIIVSVLSAILLIVVVLFNSQIVRLLKNDEIDIWLYFVPITVFFIGLFNLLNYYNNRKKQYKDLAKATVIKSFFLAVFQLAIGFVKSGATGLITGQIISQLAANMRLLKNIIKDRLANKIRKVKILALAKKYKKFPKFSMTAILSNMLSVHLINILISTFYNVKTLGMYSLVQKVLGAPTSLIGNSVGQVFFEKATQEKNNTGTAIITFNSTVRKLFFVGFPVFFIIFFSVESLFAFLFGEEWRIAGKYARIVTPLFFIRFVVVAVTVSNSIFEKQDISFYWQISLLFFNLLIMYIANKLNFTFEFMLTLLMLVMSLHYVILYFILRLVVKLKL